MFIASSSEVMGGGARVAVGRHRHRHGVLAEERDRRRLGFAQGVVRAGQDHRDRSRRRHGAHAVRIDVFQVVGRQPAELGRELRAAEVRQLLGVDLHGQTEVAGGGEDARAPAPG